MMLTVVGLIVDVCSYIMKYYYDVVISGIFAQ